LDKKAICKKQANFD